MERRVRLLSKLCSWWLPVFILGCQPRDTPDLPMLNYQDIDIQSRKGELFFNDSLFSGTIFGLYPHTSDTSFVKSYLQGKEHGTWKQFYPDGRLKEERYFSQGKKEGKYQAWWPDGQPRLTYHFHNGEYEGTCREWNAKGVLIKEMNYKQGYEAGRQQLWYNNGKIKSNYVMKDGRRYGMLGTKNCTNVTDSIF